MPSPKSGNAGTAISPADPDAAQDADTAVAGSVDQSQGAGASNNPTTLDSAQVPPAASAAPAAPAAPLTYPASSGASLAPTPGQTTTIVGNYSRDLKGINAEMGNVKSVDFGPKPGGYNTLNVPDDLADNLTPQQFWDRYNKPWLDAAIQRGDVIVFATEPAPGMLSKPSARGGTERTGFGREFHYLQHSGYDYDPVTKRAVKKS